MNECKKCILVLFFVLLIIYPLVSASDGSGPKNIFNKRYVLYSLDLSKQDGINRFIGVMDRAAAAGYNGIVLGGPYHARNYSQTMVNNTVFLVNYGRRLGLVLIPGHFDQRDPLNDVYDDLRGKNELAEAVPVVDTKFVVEEGTPLVDVLPNSGFEEWSGLQVKGLSVDALGVIAFKDVTVKHSGNASLRIQDTFLNPPYFHGRVMTSFLSVEPNRVYQLSLWVKTEGFSQPSKFKVYIRGYDENETGMNVLLDAYRAITSTQDWTEYKINFTNGNKTKLLVYFGFWVNATGKVWFDDANLSEVGFDGVSQRNPVATARMDPQVVIPNAGFEEWSATSGVPFNLSVDKLNLVIYRDTEVKHSGNTSIRIQDTFLNPPYFPGRIILNPIAVQPFRTYELSVWLKTQDVNKPDKISAYVSGYNTNGYQNLTLFTEGYSYGMGAFVSSTQNWTQYKFVINTFYETRIRVYFGLWYNTSGKVWFDDVNITELGLYNTIRRNFMPVVVESSDGNTVYQEGTDYVVRNQKLSIPTGSALSVGSELKVSWYQLGNMIDGAAPASACQERFYTELKKDAQKLNALFLNPPAFFVGYDEWRLANWDPACKDINGEQDMTGGQYMAYAMNRTEKLIKEVRPDAEVIVWADMFDPFHNAVPNYYAVRGTVEGAWEGVSPNTIIMNWGTRQNNDTRTNEPQSWSSLKFFAGRGNHQMIAGYYDTGDRDFFCDKWWLAALNALENTSEGISDIDGYMYTTFGTGKDWYYGNYDDLEAVAELMKSRGRWGTNTLVDYDNINVVSNPGFEEGMTNWSVANDPSKGQTVEDIVHSGNKSLRIQNYNSSTYPIAFQSINLVPNSSYFLSGWVKTGELSASGASYNQATIAYEWTALNGRWGSGVYTFVKANSDWTKAQYSFVLPTNYSRGNVILYLPKAYDIDNKVTTGTAWFDDISITSPVSFYVIIRYPTYRNTIYPGQEKKVTVGVRTARTHFLQISDYSIELTFFDSNNQTISRITEPYDGSQPWNSYSVDLSNYPSGNYSVLVKLLLKINGFELKSKNLSFKIAEPTTPFPKVYIDENNRIVVDGELFFPLGFYHSASLNETIAVLNRLNNSKFNTMLSYASNWWGPKAGTDFLNAAQNKSIKIIYSVKDCFNGSRYIANNTPPWKGTTGVLTGLVSFFKNHSALLGWYMNDELTDKYLPQLQENYELIKSIDPDHPALQILYTSEPLDLHVNNTDVIGIDHYPVLASRLNQPKLYEFGESTKKIATTVMNSRGIWMVPECSSQKSYFISLGRNPNETRAPTYEEMMALSYQGLVFGARGLIFYQLSILLNENGEPQWEVMKRVGEQLDSIKPIVLGIDAPAEKSVSSSSPKISVLTRLVGDEVYALAVNPYYENNSATFTIGSGLNAERIEVGLPGVPQRTIALNSLSFSDELESLGTRVYRIILPSIPSGSIPNQPGPGGSSGPGVPGGSSNRTTTTSNETSTTASETSTSLECDVNQTKCVESNAGNFLFACIGGAWKNTKECSAGCTKIGVGGTCRQETNETLVSAYSRILAEVNTLLADAKVAGLDVSSEESELKKAVGFKSAGDYSNAVETVLKARKSLQSKLANAPKEVLGLDAQRTIGLSGVALALVFLVYSYVRRRRKETRPPYLLSKTQKESAGNW